MKYFFTLIAAISAMVASCQTWNQDIAPIVYEHCGKCHHEGGIAPSSLITYEEASAEASSMLSHILSGEMPPWPANHNYTTFVDQNVLSEAEVDAITAWVQSGAPQGNGNAPTPPSYSDGYQIADPDQIVAIPSYTVESDEDVYRSFLIQNNSAAAFNIDQIEFDPDNTDIVHHVLAWYDPSNIPQQLDNAEAGPGWTSNGGSFPSDNAVLIGVWVPGMGITDFPQNLAIPVPAGADFVIEVHYAPGSLAQTSNVAMRLKYSTASNIRPVSHDPLLYHTPPSLVEPALIIPPNEVSTFHQRSEIAPVDLSFLSLFPHMHLLGKTYKVYGLTSAQDTIRFIDVDHYDFHWQFSYKFPTLLRLPAGSQLHGVATYDNTPDNEHNPNNPPQTVTLGENTTDEMMVCFFMYTPYQSGDENISQVSIYEPVNDSKQRVLAFPNPARESFMVDYPNHVKHIRQVQMIGTDGRAVQPAIERGTGRMTVNTAGIAPGVYQVIITADEGVFGVKVILQ